MVDRKDGYVDMRDFKSPTCLITTNGPDVQEWVEGRCQL